MIRKQMSKLFFILTLLGIGSMGIGCSKSQEESLAESSREPFTTAAEWKQESVTEEEKKPELILESEPSVTEQKEERNSIEKTSSIASEDDIVSYGDRKTIEGFHMVDGADMPIEVEFYITDVQKGEAAYQKLISNNEEIPKAEAGMEYMIVTLNVTYKEGSSDTLYLMENYASLDSAKMYFSLSNGDSNAEQVTNYLSDNIYNLCIEKGKSAQGSVAFLHKIDRDEPLCLIGYGKIIKFDLIP